MLMLPFTLTIWKAKTGTANYHNNIIHSPYGTVSAALYSGDTFTPRLGGSTRLTFPA